MTSRLHRNSDFIPPNLRFRSFTLSCEFLCFQRVERCLCIFEFALINDGEFYLSQSSLLSWTNRKVDPILLFLCKIFQIYLYNYYLSIISYLPKYFFLVNKRHEGHRTNEHELIVFVVFKQAFSIFIRLLENSCVTRRKYVKYQRRSTLFKLRSANSIYKDINLYDHLRSIDKFSPDRFCIIGEKAGKGNGEFAEAFKRECYPRSSVRLLAPPCKINEKIIQ